MKTDQDEHLLQQLRLAQLEIKLLREQLAQTSKETTEPARAEVSAPPASVAAAAPPEKNDVVPMKPPRTAVNGASPTGQVSRVLYVEDSEPNFRLIETILQDRPGTDLSWAESGQEGLDLALERRPQLVLLDLDLPDMHGSKVLEKLQSQPETAETPVIVISADATPSQIERMLSAGARNYLTKPFEIRRFLCMFDEIFAPA